MKALKIGGFFLAGAIIQTVFYLLNGLMFLGYALFFLDVLITCLGVVLGIGAYKLAEKKMKMPPHFLALCYVAGTMAVIAAIGIITEINCPYYPADSTGLGNLPNLGRNLAFGMFFFTIPSALVNAVVQIVWCVRDKLKQNKENKNGTL